VTLCKDHQLVVLLFSEENYGLLSDNSLL
jgi:hypothetical protein